MSVPYTVIAKYPYTPSAENASDDLAFNAGQLITVTEEVDADWLFGTTKTGGELVSGYFPRNFVERQAEDEPELAERAEIPPHAPDETQTPAEPKVEPPVAQPSVSDPVSNSAPDPVPQSVVQSVPDPSSLKRESTEPIQSTIEHGTSDFKHKLQSFNVSSAPPMPGQVIADPNFAKKPFVAASPHSTYVSPVERRESRSDERRVSSGSATLPLPPLPAQPTADEPTSAEEDAPRLTLKERLRLLEERQREEQAAAEALMKRREEKKKKKEMLKEDPAEENDETEEEEHKEDTEKETATEDEEDEEDEEEAKRRQLRERMAKLSGGMGMIGMMGFGAPMPTKEKKVKESKRTDDEAAAPVPGPVPVLPIKPEPQDPATAAPESAGEESEESNDHESVDLTKQPDVGDEEDLPTELEEPKQLPSAANPARSSPPPIPTSPAVPLPPTVTALPASFYAAEPAQPPPPQDTESESDEEYKSASSASPTLPVSRPVAPVPPIPAPVPTSPPAPAVAEVPRAPTSTAPPLPPVPAVPPVPPPMSDSSEEVVTGYEADDDTDIAQAEKPVDSPVRPAHAAAPPPPITKAPTAPLPPKTSPAVPAARPPPPIPTSPLTQTGTRAVSLSSVQSKERRVSGSKTATSHAPPPPPPVAAPVQTDNTGSTMHSGFRSSLEISDYGSSSKWWLTKSLPAELSGKDVYYEVDSHEIKKRNGKTVVYLDYYIVNQDYSTKIWELSYDAANPDKLATFVETVREKPATNSTYLLEASRKYGAVAFQLSSSAVGSSKIQEDLVSWVFKQLPRDVMPAVGSKTFGATIYRNTNNVEINQLDEIRPGDVLVVLKGRFEGHSSGPFHKSKTAELGFSGKPYTAILAGFDPSKGKIKVIEQTAKGVQSGAYKLGDFKSGKIRIFRIVGRNYFGW
ncbi:hypothetical protein KL938_003515 [Ogataea parapolymorpha]|nr:hypothetical protein KL938_003515 [Ogataea parapolymorpha]